MNLTCIWFETKIKILCIFLAAALCLLQKYYTENVVFKM